jgi:hypothetical protein
MGFRSDNPQVDDHVIPHRDDVRGVVGAVLVATGCSCFSEPTGARWRGEVFDAAPNRPSPGGDRFRGGTGRLDSSPTDLRDEVAAKAKGHSNPEIAKALIVTPRTVETASNMSTASSVSQVARRWHCAGGVRLPGRELTCRAASLTKIRELNQGIPRRGGPLGVGIVVSCRNVSSPARRNCNRLADLIAAERALSRSRADHIAALIAISHFVGSR